MTDVVVRVPGTTANLGPGFDCLGAAVTCANEFSFTVGVPGDRHLAADAYRATCADLGIEPVEVSVDGCGDVPRARGLGSSSTCVVAGVLAAAAIHGVDLSAEDAVSIATRIEGHPDNVAPAVLGGVVASMVTAGGATHAVRVPLAHELSLLALVPDQPLSTAAARAALPSSVPFPDAVFNVGRAATLVAALAAGDDAALADAFADRLHQPARAHLIPGVGEMLATATDSGALGAYVSGAGPTLMVVGPAPQTRHALEALLDGHPWEWDLRPLSIDPVGARVR